MRTFRLLILASIAVIGFQLHAPAALAAPSAFGIRGGVTDDVDSIFFGGHIAIHTQAVPNLRLEPSIEFGFGDDDVDDYFTIRGSLNFKYMIPLDQRTAFYPIFGPSLHYIDHDYFGDDTEAGLDLGIGFAFSGIGLDLIFGLPNDNLPDITLTISYTFW